VLAQADLRRAVRLKLLAGITLNLHNTTRRTARRESAG